MSQQRCNDQRSTVFLKADANFGERRIHCYLIFSSDTFKLKHESIRISVLRLNISGLVLRYHQASDGCGRAASCLDRLFDRLRVKNIGRWR